jgi:hypothetical protein
MRFLVVTTALAAALGGKFFVFEYFHGDAALVRHLLDSLFV